MKLGFLGFGHLGRAIDAGLLKAGVLSADEITVCAKSEETREFARTLGHDTAQDADELFANCDVVVLSIKPKVFREMKEALSAVNTQCKRVISVMAAVSVAEVGSVLRCPVMRVMPTIAITEAEDILAYTESADFSDIIPALSRLGDAIPMAEDQMERLTVAASCGLGFAAHILDVYRDQCMKMGFSESEADLITSRIFSYAAQSDSFAELERLVATKGGVTEAGIRAMDSSLRESVSTAFGTSFELAQPKK